MPFKNITVRARACCPIRKCRDFQKKGKRKPTCHFPSSVYSLPSIGVFTFRIVLNRILHKSSLLAPWNVPCNLETSRSLQTARGFQIARNICCLAPCSLQTAQVLRLHATYTCNRTFLRSYGILLGMKIADCDGVSDCGHLDICS